MKIQINNLCKKYGKKVIFDNFSASVDFDGILMVKGKSGLGKTTLIKMLAGLEKPNSGEISVPAEKISFMFQEDRLLPWFSAKENIEYVSDGKAADYYLERVLLCGEKDTLVSELSGGMKRRVALARALAYKSELVILDEPFKGLDIELKKKMIALILEEKRQFLIITHEAEDAVLLGANVINIQ